MISLNSPDFKRLCERLTSLEALHPRYDHLTNNIQELHWDDIPLMDKNDIRRASDELSKRSLGSKRTVYLFNSGGTTGSPKLSLIPHHFFLDDILLQWKPLEPKDVLLNLFLPGKLWASHYFYNMLAERCGADLIPLGALESHEYDVWQPFFESRQITSIAATPSTIEHLLESYRRTGQTLTTLKKILWVGEALEPRLETWIREQYPNVKLWGLYGSIETWVIGYNFPGEPISQYHLLPYQLVELLDTGEICVSNIHPDSLNPLLRYKTGDCGAWSYSNNTILEVRGRVDQLFKLRSSSIDPESLIYLAKSRSEVNGAQLLVDVKAETIELVVTTDEAVNEIWCSDLRRYILHNSHDINNLFSEDGDDFTVSVVPHLSTNPRTHKTPSLIRR